MSKNEYPMTYEEFEKRVFELYLKEYPEDKQDIIIKRLDKLLKDNENCLKRIYEDTRINYLRSDCSRYCDDISKYNHFKSLAVRTLQLYIGGNFDEAKDMPILEKIEKNFHLLINGFFLREEDIGDYDYHLPKITKELFAKEDFNRVPGMYGGFFYFLKLENGIPILYVNASSRMGLDELYIIDEICYAWSNREYYEIFRESNMDKY